MKTRPLSLLLTFSLLIGVCARVWSATPVREVPAPVTTAPTTSTPPPSGVAAMPPAGPEVIVKDADGARAVVVTKTKDSSGKDTLSVDFPDEDIRNILRNVADLFELNLVIPETLQGKASIKLREVTWRQIFQVVLTPVGFTYIEEGNIIKIISNESLLQEPVSTEVFVVNYARASDLLPTLKSLVTSPGGKIDIDTRSNSLIITEAPSRMNRIRPILEQLDRATDQVMIESKFVEVTDGDVRNIGVNWASLRGYHVGVGSGSTDGTFGSYGRQQGQASSVGSNATNASSNGSTGGTTTGTTNSTTNGTTGASTTSSSITSTNGVPTSTSTTGVTGGVNTNSTTGTQSGTTGGTTTVASDTVNLLNSLTNTGNTTRALSAVFTADQFGLILSALNELTTAKIVSNPTVVTLNNTEAFINIGKEYPLPKYTYNEQRGNFEVAGFEYKPIGIILKVTPQVNARGFIKLIIEPTVSSFNDADSVNFGGASGAKIPVIQTKNVKTQISLKDGFTMGIGGLIDSSTSNADTKVPVLGSIPILGRLFSSKSKVSASRNLLIFLTAKTLPAEGAPPGQIFDPRQIRQMNLKREELPGFRDGSDPFPVAPAAASAHGKDAQKISAK
jgi:type II secretory pathway component GspD/PulD (secretin)